MFRTVFPSIIRSPRLYIQHQLYVIQFRWLHASGREMEKFHLVPSPYTHTHTHTHTHIYIYIYIYIYTHTHTYIYIYTHTHIFVCVCVGVCVSHSLHIYGRKRKIHKIRLIVLYFASSWDGLCVGNFVLCLSVDLYCVWKCAENTDLWLDCAMCI